MQKKPSSPGGGKEKIEHEGSEKELNSEDDLERKAKMQVSQMQLMKLILSKEQLFEKIKQLMDEACSLIDRSLFQESNFLLQQAEEIIEFAANKGKSIERNLIITVLYNRACSYQGLWKLDKCNKYIDAVIYNLESNLKNESSNSKDRPVSADKQAAKIKTQTFLVKCYLQQCAILSQLVLHQKAIETAKKTIKLIEEMYNSMLAICKEKSYQSQSLPTCIITSQKFKQPSSQSSQTTLETKSSPRPSSAMKSSTKLTPKHQQSEQAKLSEKSKNTLNSDLESQFFANLKKIAKEEVIYSRLIPQIAQEFLEKFNGKGIFNVNIGSQGCNQLKNARQSIYFWKSNPENNEKNMRQELNVQVKNSEEDNRNILGIQNGQEWIEQFNIGSIMHMTSVSYEEFSMSEDILFELTKKQLVEKVECLFQDFNLSHRRDKSD